MHVTVPLIVTACCLFGPANARSAEPRSLGDLTGPWQLFVDDYLIASRENVVRTYHPFEKHPANPVLLGDKPWEAGNIYLYGTVLPAEDGRGYRMWYQTIPGGDRPNNILYATSEDGLHWTKPPLAIQSIDGSRNNNAVLPEGGGFMGSVIHAPRDPDPAGRYKLMSFGRGGWFGACSPDGIHYTPAPDQAACRGGGDSAQFFWDPLSRQYVGLGKVIFHVDGQRRRCVGRTCTADFGQWPPFELVLAPDTFDDRWAKGVQRTHLYGLSAFAYETMYLGFLWIFRATDDEGYLVGPLFVELVTSRDGVHWLRQEGDRPPILPLGPTGAWDDGMVLTPNHPLVEGDRIRLYYGGFDEEHGMPMHGKIGLATLRKDGFASLDAAGGPGTIVTKRLAGARGTLRVNVAGRLRVEVLDENGSVIDGYGRDDCLPLDADSTDQPVAWKTRSALPGDRPAIRLRFLLARGSLYSFTAGQSVKVIDEPPAPTLAALYTFENDSRRSATDALTKDGPNEVRFLGAASVDRDPDHAAFGKRSMAIGSEFSQLNTLEIVGTANLGTQFTLGLAVRFANNAHARLFSSFDGCGPIRTHDLVFDCDPAGKVVAGLRLFAKGIPVESGPVSLADGRFHHLAVTYDDGRVCFYADGRAVGTARVPGGAPVRLKHNLFVANDAGLGAGAQLTGRLDDILVLGRALSSEEVATLATKGAAALFGRP